jgi:hypothetical protein
MWWSQEFFPPLFSGKNSSVLKSDPVGGAPLHGKPTNHRGVQSTAGTPKLPWAEGGRHQPRPGADRPGSRVVGSFAQQQHAGSATGVLFLFFSYFYFFL